MLMRPCVVIATPTARHWDPRMGYSMTCLGIESANAGLDLAPRVRLGNHIEENRNVLVSQALDLPGRSATHILWVDSDMAFPSGLLLRLLKHGVSVVGCDYRGRHPPFPALGEPLNRNEEFGSLRQMKSLPGGLVLVSTELYRKIPPPWYEVKPGIERDELTFWPKVHALGHDIWCDMELTVQVRHVGDVEIPWE